MHLKHGWVGVAGWCLLGPLQAQGELARYLAPNGRAADIFGSDLALSEEHALIGAWLADVACPLDPQCQSGAVYLFRRVGLNLHYLERWSPPDARREDYYGNEIALADEVAVVVSARDGRLEQRLSVAFVYQPDDAGRWQERARLHAPEQRAVDQFGSAIATDGRTIAVGAPGDFIFGYEGAGSVHLFEPRAEAWVHKQRLQAWVPCPRMQFGAALSLDDSWLVVGAPGDPHAGDASGAAYVYQRQGEQWHFSQRLTAPVPGWYDSFGSNVALHADKLLVAARGEDAPLPDMGAVYLYQLEGGVWQLSARLQPHHLQAGLNFGWSLAIADATALIGSPIAAPEGEASGAIWAFRETAEGWQQVAELSARAGVAQDFFGQSLALDGDLALTGAAGVDVDRAQSIGAAYTLQIPSFATPYCHCSDLAPCQNVDATGGCTNSSGRGARLSVLGSNELDPPGLRVLGSDLPAQAFCTLLLGLSGPARPFGDGWLCLAPLTGAVVSLAHKATSQSGHIIFQESELSRLGHYVLRGRSYALQLSFRDREGPCGTGRGASSALLLQF